ncbi:hypothetical protein V8D89_004132 [Ganoderma adspersum]
MKGISRMFARYAQPIFSPHTSHPWACPQDMQIPVTAHSRSRNSRRFESLEKATEKLIKDSKAYTDAVTNLFTNAVDFGQHFATVCHPFGADREQDRRAYRGVPGESEGDLEEHHEVVVQGTYLVAIAYLRSRRLRSIQQPVDYDRYNNSLTKPRDKKEQTLNDEKNLFKLEQDFEIASNEYDYINSAMKSELSRFIVQAMQFVDALFHTSSTCFWRS